MALIEARHLWKEYAGGVVLENFNAKVEEGEFVTVVGSSGCGKTTLLNILLGAESHSRGELLFDGNPFPKEPDASRGIVFQRYSVFPHLNALENVMLGIEFEQSRFFGKLFGRRWQDIRGQAADMLHAVGLGNSMMKYPHQLSGGMQQRLAIAQSLIKRPRVLLLDEPFGALDSGIRADMHTMLLKLWRETGTTIFMVTHDIKEGFYLGTRLWVVDKRRHDPHNPGAYGSHITYDLPVGQVEQHLYEEITVTLRNQ